MLCFWATWWDANFSRGCSCGDTCAQKSLVPYLQELYGKHKSKGFEPWLVSIDLDALTVKRFLVDAKVSFPILLDIGLQVARLYGVKSLSALFIINKKGIIRYVRQGFRPGNQAHEKDVALQLINVMPNKR